MAYLNKVMLIGNLGKDMDVKALANGDFASFSLATSRRYRDNNGEQKEQTDWHNIVVFGKTVSLLQQLHVGKGSTLYVEGTLTNRVWTDPTSGQKRYTTEVRLDNFQLLATKSTAVSGNASASEQIINDAMNAAYDDLPF